MGTKLNLFPRSMADTTNPEVYPQVTMARVVDPFAQATPASNEFNLVRIVEEHGPKRLEQIDALIKGYQDKIDKLAREREQVQALVLALK